MKPKEFFDKYQLPIGNIYFMNDFASVIAEAKEEAIAEHEQSQWKPYPEFKPIEGNKYYYVQGMRGTCYKMFWEENPYIKRKWMKKVIAFRELPKGYRKEEQK